MTFGLIPCLSFGQTVVSIADGTVSTCNGILYDTGGAGGAGYQNGENFTLTICPNIPGDVVTVTFNNFNLNTTNTATPPANNADNISIYDGNSTGAPTLGTYTGNQLQGNIVYCTSGNLTGCLTFVFTSNNSGTGVFSASITCTTPCSPPSALFTSPTVPQNPQKICDGETINFDASGSTPQGAFIITDYIFAWGDGTFDTLQTPFASHTYNSGPGEYLTQLYVIDDNGCINMNSEIIKVWVSTTPNFNTFVDNPNLCLGESTCLDGSTITPVMYTPSPSSSLTGTTYLPDDPGACFDATLNYSFFNPGQTLNNINDLHGICVDMEHSFMGDLVATITCPNGTSVVMHQQGGGGTNLGHPMQVDDSLQPGTGLVYCWSPQAVNGTWEDNAQFGITPNTFLNNSGSQSLVPGDYESVNPLNPLVGCPLNGVWTLEFCDLWGADDGFVFDFWIDLDTSLYPSLTTFTPFIGSTGDSTFWTSSGQATTFITSTTADSNIICVTPTDTGSFDYTYYATDDFGCTYDTTITITVVPGPTVDAGIDTSLCAGSIYQLNADGFNNGPGPCNYTIDMFDTFGDGWNGFEVEVIINGVSIGTFTFTAGSTSTANFNYNNGDAIQINTISGVFDGEVSYQIIDCLGNVVFQDGVNYNGTAPVIGANVWNNSQNQFNYSWTPITGLSNPNIANPTFTLNNTVTYIVEKWEPNHQLCSAFDTVTITITPAGATAGIDGDTILCKTYAAFDMFNVLNGAPDTGGIWIDANNNPVTNIFDPATDVSGIYTYYIGSGSCGDTALVTIINPDSVIILSTSSDTTICENATISIEASAIGGTGALSLIWDNGLIGNGPHIITPNATTTYSVYAEDTLGCPSTPSTITVTTIPSLSAGNDGDTILCRTYASFDMFNVLTGSPDVGGQWIDATNNIISNIFDPSLNTSGVYYYYVGTASCSDTASVTVTNPDSVIITNTTSDTIICVDGTAFVYALATGGTGALSLIWDNGLIGSGPHNTNPTDSIMYTVYAQDTLGCTSIANTVIVTLFDSITIDNIPPETVCSTSPGNTTSLTANANGGDGNGYTYEWRDGNNNIIGTTQTITVSPISNPETYTVYVGDNCTTPLAMMTVDVFWHPLMLPNFDTIVLDDFCYPVDITFNNTTNSPLVQSIEWNFGDGNTSNQDPTVTHQYANPGTYNVTLEVTSTDGCIEDTTALALVTVYDYPDANFSYSPVNPTTNNTEITFNNLSTGNLFNFWSFYLGSPATSTSINPVVLFPDDSARVYPVELIVENAAGCRDTTTGKFVKIDGVYVLYVPNAFTPNGDGVNDMFRAYGDAIELSNFTMQIFDRWGALLFESNNIEYGWDGTYKGKLVQTGSYVWKIIAKERYTPIIHNNYGHVTLNK